MIRDWGNVPAGDAVEAVQNPSRGSEISRSTLCSEPSRYFLGLLFGSCCRRTARSGGGRRSVPASPGSPASPWRPSRTDPGGFAWGAWSGWPSFRWACV